jgi:hypothetical protein
MSSVYFKKGARQLRTCGSPTPEDFLMVLGRILFMERYETELEFSKSTGQLDEILQKADSAMVWEKGEPGADSLDISELWTDSYEIPLIMGFWVCPAEDFHPNVVEFIHKLWDSSLPLEQEVIESNMPDDGSAREGFILRKWNDDIEGALDKTIDLLFYHQLINELEAVKVLGRD